MSRWAARLAVCAVAAGLAAAVWFFGQYLALGEVRPLVAPWARTAAAGTLVAAAAVILLLQALRGSPPARSLALPGDARSDPEGIGAQLAAALGDIRKATGRRDPLGLPWYLLLDLDPGGQPSSAPTVKLVPAEGAMLIAAPTRLALQASPLDGASWLALLRWLKAAREPRPVEGIVALIPIPAGISGGKLEPMASAAALRARLAELGQTVGGEIPLHAVFTGTAAIPGFSGFLASRGNQAWGANLAPGEIRQAGRARLDAALDALGEELSTDVADRMQDAADPRATLAAFGLPRRFAGLKAFAAGMLDGAADPARAGAGVRLRSIHFIAASKRPDGSPPPEIVRIIGKDPARPPGRMAPRAASPTLRYAGLAAIVAASAALAAAWGVSFMANRSLIARTTAMLEQEIPIVEPYLAASTVADVELENIVGALAALRDLPAGYAGRDAATPIGETFGLSQRAKLTAAAETAYGRALERLLRARLVLQLERTIQGSIASPGELFEPLKIYLMLSGHAPRVDDDLIVAWMRRDWEQNRYPGAANRDGRRELESHLRAMLALDGERVAAIDLDRALIEAAQRSLSRMSLSEIASALMGAASRSAQMPAFTPAELAGPQAEQVFSATEGRGLTSLSVPGVYTYQGFHDFLLPQLAGLADRLVDDQWVTGAGSAQVGIEQELRRLGPQLLDRYDREFLSAWTRMLDGLRLKPLTEDRPDYVALAALASPASPLRQLVEAVAGQTGLLRAPPGGDGDQAAEREAALQVGLARVGIDFNPRKSQTRAGGAFARASGETPGAVVEARFRPFQALVEGAPGRRPIDVLVQNLQDIRQSLVIAAANPAQAQRAAANLQLQVYNLKRNASRFPDQLATMINAAADELEGDVARTSAAQLGAAMMEAVGNPCQALVADSYPFAPGGGRDAPMGDFIRLFAPGGQFDRFFAQNLAALADIGGPEWTWKKDARIGRDLSPAILKSFQRAAEIRDAFFPAGSTMPSVRVSLKPFSQNNGVELAEMNVDGQVVQSYRSANIDADIEWPGEAAAGAASLQLRPALPGRPSDLRFEGPWAFMRLLKSGSFTGSGDSLQLRFVLGGRDVTYSVAIEGKVNPFDLPALSDFRCPQRS